MGDWKITLKADSSMIIKKIKDILKSPKVKKYKYIRYLKVPFDTTYLKLKKNNDEKKYTIKRVLGIDIIPNSNKIEVGK